MSTDAKTASRQTLLCVSVKLDTTLRMTPSLVQVNVVIVSEWSLFVINSATSS